MIKNIKKKLDLNGLRILNTRPQTQGQALNQAIKDAGGQVIHCPTLAIIPIAATGWLPLLPPLSTLQYAVFTSVNAVNCFFDGLENHTINWPKQIMVIAIGKATAHSLEKRNIPLHFVPKETNSEHLLALPILQKIKKHTVLLIKGEGGRTLIAETLTARGGNLIILNVYRRSIPELDLHELTSLWQNDAIDIIVFTSQEAMYNLFVLLGAQAREWLQQKPCLVISSRLAEAGSLMGIKNISVCQPDTILDELHQHQRRLQGRLINEKRF